MVSDDEALSHLVDEIRHGRCIAFLGAGFSMPVARAWSDLLGAIAGHVSTEEVADQIKALIARGGASNFEIAAQMLEDEFAAEQGKLVHVVRHSLGNPRATTHDDQRLIERTRLLGGIPFSAILTTNFDEHLRGKVLDRTCYAELLRDADQRWLERSFWNKRRPPVLKLHGDLHNEDGITLSRRGYRQRLFNEPGYLNVLRTIFMTKTFLFIGFSFTDAYLNQLRSEALAYLGATPQTLAYAIMPETSPAVRRHYSNHEGVHVFGYEPGAAHDHSFVDTMLAKLHESTNPQRVMGARLKGKRILWNDPSEQNNVRGYAALVEAADGLLEIEIAYSPDEALQKLTAKPYDLVISRWGHHPNRKSDAETLLEGMRKEDLRAPVVIFASRAGIALNREAALKLGVLEYTASWDRLFEVIDRRFC
jgi:hypothetical protein